jgi:cbb3-type cytochrome oxidase maturation protein
MDVLYLLIPLSVLLMLGLLGLFAWALQGGQFDQLDAQARRALLEDEDDDGAVDRVDGDHPVDARV